MLTVHVKIKRLAALAGVVAMVGSGSTSALASHHRHHHRAIVQHNLGDHDADNNGGPSDGDGSI